LTYALALRGLSKTFKAPAVDALTLSVRAGELYALLGPNGAGKTTTLRMVVRLQLEEGTYLVANLQGVGLEDMSVGMPVQVFFEQVGDFVTPQCRSVERAAA
jgi:ABC-type multidrug transport system ATPase subunit